MNIEEAKRGLRDSIRTDILGKITSDTDWEEAWYIRDVNIATVNIHTLAAVELKRTNTYEIQLRLNSAIEFRYQGIVGTIKHYNDLLNIRDANGGLLQPVAADDLLLYYNAIELAKKDIRKMQYRFYQTHKNITALTDTYNMIHQLLHRINNNNNNNNNNKIPYTRPPHSSHINKNNNNNTFISLNNTNNTVLTDKNNNNNGATDKLYTTPPFKPNNTINTNDNTIFTRIPKTSIHNNITNNNKALNNKTLNALDVKTEMPKFNVKLFELYNAGIDQPTPKKLKAVLTLLTALKRHKYNCSLLNVTDQYIAFELHQKLCAIYQYKFLMEKFNNGVIPESIAEIYNFIKKHWLKNIEILLDEVVTNIVHYEDKTTKHTANAIKINVNNIVKLLGTYKYYYNLSINYANISLDNIEYKQPKINITNPDELYALATYPTNNKTEFQTKEITVDNILKVFYNNMGINSNGKHYAHLLHKHLEKLGDTQLPKYLRAMFQQICKWYDVCDKPANTYLNSLRREYQNTNEVLYISLLILFGIFNLNNTNCSRVICNTTIHLNNKPF